VRLAFCKMLVTVAPSLGSPGISIEDSDAMIQVCGVSVLEHLLYLDLIEPEEAEELLRKAERHENGAVRERAESIRSFLRERAEGDNHDGAGDGRDVAV
jgi:hypothetical protein